MAIIAAILWIAGCTVAAPAYGLTSSTPSPTVSSPATHTYDDGHTDQSSTGSNPAFWILSVAVIGLIAIAVIMLRAGRPPRTHLSRGEPPPGR
ncbi:hypothetical protein [Mycolicibacterium goodii]|uniref:Uncharacterized protein n=1 Tax=Mycolicibacterium goodii TaxID=134601 RepID=A0ABS6HXT1_MYCGD|nr:hypothetical protein [Mycolicibacterium goodii]MBU8827013.1 hypothetical protein [Mycolicibacterium goodii]MBU8840463.1 hypothetical protein [Mycolicibacterium goodii]